MDTDTATMLIMAGISSANRWNLRVSDVVHITRIPPGTTDYYIPVIGSLDSEHIYLEHFKHSNGTGCWLGYSRVARSILYRPEQPLVTTTEKD
jgi:hypothetical protein